MQPFAQSEPTGIGAAVGVEVGSGVLVGAGVEVGSTGGTVSVGKGVFVDVAVEATGTVGMGVGSEVNSRSPKTVINVTAMVTIPPINAVIIAGSILLGDSDFSVISPPTAVE